MDQKDVEMEDAGQLLEDEVLGGQECVEKDEIAVNEGDKQEDPSGLVNADIIVQSPNEIEVEQEVREETEVQEDTEVQDEAELQDEAEGQDVQEDTEVQDEAEVQEETEVQDVQEEPEVQGMHEGQKMPEEQEMPEEQKMPEEQEVHAEQELREEQRSEDAEEAHPNETEPLDETRDTEKGDTAMVDEHKIIVSKNDTTVMMTDDDKIDDSKNDATEMAADAKIHDMDGSHGVIEETDHGGSMKISENNDGEGFTGDEKRQQLPTPNAFMTYSQAKAEDHIAETPKNELDDTTMDEGYESGTAEEQEKFMREVDAVYREKFMEFKPPKFYGQPLNCLKLWRSVIKLGGYDRVTGAKWWRQVGEAFHPPKTCTTVSWTFRQFYEKALLEYERHKVQTREIELPLATVFPEAPTLDIETNGHQTPGSGSGRARRDAASRAMQGWHAQRLLGFGGEEKNSGNPQKREKSLKSIGSSLKHKRPSEVEYSVKAARTEASRQVVTTVADVGPPANWVKINVRETKDCFEVYALVPGLLREEVRVQSDPAGRLVITGQPEQLDNPWGISAFKKVISLPGRIDPLRTSAIVSLHGRLLVRVPFEQSNI